MPKGIYQQNENHKGAINNRNVDFSKTKIWGSELILSMKNGQRQCDSVQFASSECESDSDSDSMRNGEAKEN